MSSDYWIANPPGLKASESASGCPANNLGPLKGAISDEVVRGVNAGFPGQVLSIILTGSLARLEATCVARPDVREVVGDAEFLLVFTESAALPAASQVESVRQQVESALRQRAILCPVSFGVVHPQYFHKLRPSIFAYELRTCGEAVWGSREVLEQAPTFSNTQIPFEDGWRTLCNRLIEQLEAVEQALVQPSTCQLLHYRTVKLYLDMATSLLVFLGAYEPSYFNRAERLSLLASGGPNESRLPFPLLPFAERVAACTEFKLSGTTGSPLVPGRGDLAGVLSFWRESVGYARQLWRWELTRLAGVWEPFSDRVLMKKWMRRQTVRDKIRGWMYVARKCGWQKSHRQWRRWVRMAWHGSPRYCLYDVASQACFRLPEVVGALNGRANQSFDWGALYARIPAAESSGSNGHVTIWQQVARDIVANYRDFLTDTCS